MKCAACGFDEFNQECDTWERKQFAEVILEDVDKQQLSVFIRRYDTPVREVYIYACPKCDTLRIDR